MYIKTVSLLLVIIITEFSIGINDFVQGEDNIVYEKQVDEKHKVVLIENVKRYHGTIEHIGYVEMLSFDYYLKLIEKTADGDVEEVILWECNFKITERNYEIFDKNYRNVKIKGTDVIKYKDKIYFVYQQMTGTMLAVINNDEAKSTEVYLIYVNTAATDTLQSTEFIINNDMVYLKVNFFAASNIFQIWEIKDNGMKLVESKKGNVTVHGNKYEPRCGGNLIP